MHGEKGVREGDAMEHVEGALRAGCAGGWEGGTEGKRYFGAEGVLGGSDAVHPSIVFGAAP
jgi:hypothetical protein